MSKRTILHSFKDCIVSSTNMAALSYVVANQELKIYIAYQEL